MGRAWAGNHPNTLKYREAKSTVVPPTRRPFVMHRRKSWSDSGVSEVIGTILILAMTVVLFASIILWVSSIPSPEASTRLDMDGNLIPIYDAGVWSGANITIQHRGGESLASHRTEILLVVERGGSVDSETLQTTGTGLYRLYDDGTNGDFVANDGIFSRFDSSLKPAKSWDGGIILLKAQDLAGHVTDSRMVFEVVEGPGGG